MNDAERASVEDKQLELVLRLKKAALQQMRKTGYAGQFHTLQKTEIANGLFEDERVIEKFNRLFEDDAAPESAEIDSFIKFCTVKIKHNLIDYMRRKFAQKRGGDLQFVSLDDQFDIFADLNIKGEQIEYLNSALEKLEKETAFHADIVEKKYFLGMTNQEIATGAGVSLSKIEKDLHFAIAWLKRELSA